MTCSTISPGNSRAGDGKYACPLGVGAAAGAAGAKCVVTRVSIEIPAWPFIVVSVLVLSPDWINDSFSRCFDNKNEASENRLAEGRQVRRVCWYRAARTPARARCKRSSGDLQPLRHKCRYSIAKQLAKRPAKLSAPLMRPSCTSNHDPHQHLPPLRAEQEQSVFFAFSPSNVVVH